MNLQSFKNRNGLIILVCIAAAVLIYSIDFFKLDYRMTGWEQFGESPVTPARIQYFVADTPNLIGFKDTGGESVSCAETVAYVETEAQETYRCCDTGDRIACLAGNFSTDIPPSDEACNNRITSCSEIVPAGRKRMPPWFRSTAKGRSCGNSSTSIHSRS
jgi:hypothetical protein